MSFCFVYVCCAQTRAMRLLSKKRKEKVAVQSNRNGSPCTQTTDMAWSMPSSSSSRPRSASRSTSWLPSPFQTTSNRITRYCSRSRTSETRLTRNLLRSKSRKLLRISNPRQKERRTKKKPYKVRMQKLKLQRLTKVTRSNRKKATKIAKIRQKLSSMRLVRKGRSCSSKFN